MEDDTHVITYEQMQSFIHTLHAFDYIRQVIANDINRFVTIGDNDSPLNVLQTDSYLNRLLEIHK